MGRLKGKTALITGAALGLGRATALRMAEEGASIAVTDVLQREGQALADDLVSRGSSARYWPMDVSMEASVSKTVDDVARHFGRLDILVNNAGVAGANKPTDQLTEAEWDFVQAINVKGVFFCTKHAIPHLRAAGGGAVINLSSIYGLVSAPDVPPYHASKGAVRLMTKTDAPALRVGKDPRELHPPGVHLDADGRRISARPGRRPGGPPRGRRAASPRSHG